MRVLPMLRGVVGAITVIVWALILSDPRFSKLKDHAVDGPHSDVPGVAQPHTRIASSRLVQGDDKRSPSDEGITLGKSNEFGSTSKPSATSDPGAGALSESSHDFDLAADSNGTGGHETSTPPLGEVSKPAASAVLEPETSPIASPDTAHGGEMAAVEALPQEAIAVPKSPQSEHDVPTAPPISADAAQVPAETSPGPSGPEISSTEVARGDNIPTVGSVLPKAPTSSPSNQRVSEDRNTNASALAIRESRQPFSTALPPVPDFSDDARLSSEALRSRQTLPVAPLFAEASPTPPMTLNPRLSQDNFGSLRAWGADTAKSVEPPPSLAAPSSRNDTEWLRKFPTRNLPARHPQAPLAQEEVAQQKGSEKAHLASHPIRRKSTTIVGRERWDREVPVFSRRVVAGQNGKIDSRPIGSPGSDDEKAAPSSPETRVSVIAQQATRWHLALRRRCPSIVASADEYDADLVRLCRLSAGL